MQTLTKPASGWIALEVDGSPVKLDFDSGGASLHKDGENLVFKFDDGTSSVLQGFYQHGKDATFLVGGEEIPAQALFEAMNASDIMPAAGADSGQAASAPTSGHGQEYGNMDVLGGTWRLGGLDIGFNSSYEPVQSNYTFGDYVAGRDLDGGETEPDNPVTPEPQPEPEPQPVIPEPKPEEPKPEPVVPEPEPQPEPYTTSVRLEIPSVFEGQPIIGRIAVDNPPTEDCMVTVKIGDSIIEVLLPAGETEAEFTVDNPNGEDPFTDASTVEVQIVSVTGGGYDNTTVEDPFTVDVLDTIDEVKFSVAGEAVDETADIAVFTVTSDDPVQTGSLTVQVNIGGQEYSVNMEWTDAGWVGRVEVPVRENDLLINGKDTIEAYVVGARHDEYEWENPNYGGKTEATVIDNRDDAVFDTSISVVDGQYVVEVTSVQPYSADGYPTLNLTVNGEVQQVDLHWDEARELWTESVAFDLPAPTHSDETVHVEASLSNPSMLGLEYENPILNSAAKDIVVEHEWWPVNAVLDIPAVFEGSGIVGKIVLNNPPFEDCTVVVRVGDETIEVPVSAGSTEVEFTVDNPNGEDPFIDASTVEAEIVSINGGGYDETSLEEPITVNILDTIDEVKFAITGEHIDETAETAVFTVTSDDPVQTGSLTVQVSIDGKEYSVPMEWTDGGWTGTVEVPVRENDLLINGKDTIEAYVAGASHDGKVWENPNYGEAAEADVVDNRDDAVFNTAISVAEGKYVVEVTSVQPYSSDGQPVLTLTVNGESQQISLHWDEARELWTESVAYDLPDPTHVDETVHVEASISNPSMLGLEYENPILNPAEKDILVEHEWWPVNAVLDIPAVFEGSEIVGRIVLDNAPFVDCTATIKIGDETITVPIPAGSTEAEFTVDNPNGEDPFIDASTIEANIVSINGGGYDETHLDDPVAVNILDTIDEVKFAITGEAVDETAATAMFTVTSDDPVKTGSLTVHAVIDGSEYTVPMEWTDGGWVGTVEVPVRENDLLINGKDTIEAYIADAQHDQYVWENPNYGEATEATVVDNRDDAVFDTSISVVDGQYVVEVTSVQPYSADGHPTMTLTVNGESQQIDLHWDNAREMWVESVSFDLPAPTHSDETVHVEASISNPSMNGLEYENPILNPATKDIVVEHEPWLVNAYLEIPSVFEGNAISGKVVLDNAPFNDDCIAVVKVGDATVEVPIPANATEASFTVDNPNGEDPFIDASSIEAEIVSINGGGYDAVETEEPITVNILDTIDEVKFAISGMNVDETAITATFTITSDDPVQTGTLAVQVNIDGNEYTVPMEWVEGSGWSGSVEVSVRDNDLLINGKDTIDAYIVSAQHDNYTWENPNYGEATQSTVIDNVDDAVFNTTITAADGQYIVEVASAQPNSNEGHPTLTLTVNGEVQQIDLHWDEAREMWVESVAFDLPAPTHNDETVHVEASISNPSMMGLEYENPILNPAEKDIVVEHEWWPVNASLEVPSVFEGNAIAGTIILDNAPFVDCTATVKVGDETTTVPIPAGSTEAEFTVDNPNGEDPFIDASTIEAEIVSINGGGYDETTLQDPVTVDILDTIDEVTFAITGENVDETAATATFTVTSDDPVQTGSLTVTAVIDGQEYTVPMEWTEDGWVGTVEVPVRDNDLLINGKDTIEAYVANAQHDSYEWENPNYGEATEATVIDNRDDAVFNTAIAVAEGQYIVEVTSSQPNSVDGHPTLTLTVNGEDQQIDLHWDSARELWVESIAFDLPAPTHLDETVHVEASISNPSMNGLEYENPILNPAEKDILVEHEYWPVNASLEIPSVFEGNEIAGTVILDKEPIEDCIAVVNVGGTTVQVPIPTGSMEVPFTVENPNTEDPFIDASTIEAEIVSINGGGYDSVTPDSPITVNILDTIDEVTFTITGEAVDETAATAAFTITTDDPVTTGSLAVTVNIDGQEYSVQMEQVDGAWVGHVDVDVRENDLLINGKDTMTAYVVSAQHDQYIWENPNYGSETEVTVVDNRDDAVFNTAITAANGQYVVEVTSAQPSSAEGHPTLTLTVNGEDQQIDLHWDEARELWVESVAFDLPEPTHSDETVHVEASISNPSMLGLEYENPILNPAEKDILVEHESWPVNASLEVPAVFEGNEIAGTVVLDNAPFLDDCVAVVKVGDTVIEVPIPANASEAPFTVENPNTEDPFIDASTVQAEIIEISGGGYDSVETEAPITVNILDTIDEVKFFITGENVEETAETVTFTITSDDPVQTGSLSVVASIDGGEYDVQMEWTGDGWTGSVEVPVRENDLLINGKDTMDACIVSAQHDNYEWENPNYGEATEATVIDNKDDAVFNTAITVADGQYVVEVTSAQPYSSDGHPTLILTVNGEDQQIDLHWDSARELWVESVSYPVPEPTLVEQTLHIEASISNPSMLGLEYENPILNPAEKDIVIDPVIPQFNTETIALTVDESYIPSGSLHGKGNGDKMTAFLGAADVEAEVAYSLTFDSAETNLTAVVDGLEKPVVLQQLEDGSIVGHVQVNALKAINVFTVSVDEGGNVTVALTGNGTILHSIPDGEGEEVVLNGINAVMQAGETTAERPLELHFLDDEPSLIEDEEVRLAREIPAASQENNLLDCGPAMDFTNGSAGSRFQNGMKGVQHWAAEGVELSAAIVKFDESGRYAVEVAPPVDTLEGKTHSLVYSGHNSNQAKPWNWGLNVKSAGKWEHWAEISYDIQHHESQAVVFDLGGKLAYGITVEFGACYDPNSSVMANDMMYPEAALVIFMRDGEIVGQEIATGLSSGMESRTFGAALADGFDCAIVSSLDNDSLDPKPRNQYAHVSDNEFTIRSVDFATHPRTVPVHSVEGDLLLEPGADGISIAQKAVAFDLDAMGTTFDAVFSDGTTHTVTIVSEAGGTCLNAVAEDGTLVFNAVVGGDGIWNANIYQTFAKDGADVDDDGTAWLVLAFKTGEDADGDYVTTTMAMPTQWVDETVPVSVNVEIEAVDHTVAADATLVHADIDETLLGEGSSVEIDVNGNTHVLEWNGTGFNEAPGFEFAWHQGSISWVEQMPPAGQMLEVTVVQRWIDTTGNEMEAYGEDNAQRALDAMGRPVQSDTPVPTLEGWLDSLATVDDVIDGLTDGLGLPEGESGVPNEGMDIPSGIAAPLSASLDIPDYVSEASSTELASLVMTMQTSAG